MDWVSGNLYWTEIEDPVRVTRSVNTGDAGGRLLVSMADGRYKRSLITQNLEEPTSVALDPQLGRVYWADGGSQPKIEVAWMDGNRRKSLVLSRLGKPSALSVDHSMDHTIYWADIKLNTIESIQKDGSNRKVIISGDKIRHPVSFLDTIKENLFYIGHYIYYNNQLFLTGITGRL